MLYAGNRFEVALLETAYHHARFMARTREPEGWTSQLREIRLDVAGRLHDLRGGDARHAGALNPDDYEVAQALGRQLRDAGSDGIVYPSVRCEPGECIALLYPDLASKAIQGRHLDYHWDGERVDFYRDLGSGQVYQIT